MCSRTEKQIRLLQLKKQILLLQLKTRIRQQPKKADLTATALKSRFYCCSFKKQI